MASSDGSAVQRAQSAALNNSSLQYTGGSYVGSAIWPNQENWNLPQVYYYPTLPDTEHYANALEIQTGEHDATIRFYRQRGSSRQLVDTVTVPLSLLDLFAPKKGPKR